VKRLAWIATLAVLAGCAPTRIQFENDLPATALENVRWVPSHRDESYHLDEPGRLEPGERSKEIDIWLDDEGERGHLHFELVVGDTRVALVTDKTYKAHVGETSVFAIKRDTAVSNLLWDELAEE
jgi:hypothetical protein